MKVLVTLLMILNLSVGQSQTLTGLDIMNQAEQYVKDLYACKRNPHRCTAEQRLALMKSEGKILTRYQLEDHLAKDNGNSYFVPLTLDNEELLTLAAATSLGIVAFNYDQEIMDVVQNNKTPVTQKLSDVGNFLGSGYGMATIAAGSYFLGVIYKDNKLKQAGLFVIGASLASSIAVVAAKESFGRKRPIKGEGPYAFFQEDSKSFYSGHTNQAFTIATVISEMFKEDYPIVPYVAYGLAAVGAYARMHSQAHWASDVIIGAVAGHLITKLALSKFNGNSEGRGGLMVYPSFDRKRGEYIIMLEWTPKQIERPMKCTEVENPILRVDACFAEAFEKAGRKY